MERKPLVIVTSCLRMLGHHPHHIAGRKYVDAVRLAGALPLIAPPLDLADLEALLDGVDGVLMTGSPSNIDASNYGQAIHDPTLPLDRERDAWALPLVRSVLDRGMPLLAICRGAQEVNVALGGTLNQAVHETPGMLDHRDDHDAPVEVQYGPAHGIAVVPGGMLERIVGAREFEVNSLHGQGVARLAPRLRAEGHAPDGLIEAYTAPDAPGFNLAVQWHPEWQATANPVSMRLFEAFGQALRLFRDRARVPLPRSGAD